MSSRDGRPRKPYGFWTRSETITILERVKAGKLSGEEAAKTLACPLADVRYYISELDRKLKKSDTDPPIRKVSALGNSLVVTLPSELANAYGLGRGTLVEFEPTYQGLLLKPLKVVSALSPEGSALVKDIIRRYRPALDALAGGDRRIDNR